MNLASYILTVCTTEVIEDVKMVKDICVYHYTDQKYKRTLKKQQKKLKRKMDAQTSYESWKFYAQQYDNLPKNKEWKKKMQSKEYDYKYILKIRDELREARLSDNDLRIVHILRSHCYRNIANLMNKPLYSKLYCSTKQLIEQFMEEIKKCAQKILTSKIISQQAKVEFFVEQKHALGRTALIVSGGGLLSIYSFGVIQALVEHDMLPKIVSGSSGGSIVSALVCSQTDQELKEKISDKESINWTPFYELDQTLFPTIVRRSKHFLKKGVLLEMKRVEEFIRVNIGDTTFQEAFDRTGRILNITVTGKDQHSIQNKLLNYITAPNVIIWSAVGCSCSIPLVYGSTKLMCKDENGNIIEYLSNTEFVDGSIGGDLPMLKLAELFNTTNFIVSQTNPFILPFIDRGEKRDTNKYKRAMYKTMELFKNLFLNEARHRLLQLSQLGLVPHKINQIFHLLEQTYAGNVTIYPNPKIQDYLDVMKYPANEAQSEYCRQHGYEKSFDKIYQIKMTTFYERIIENGYKLVLEQAKNQQNTPMYMQVQEDDEECQIQIQKKSQIPNANSQLILNDNQKDDVELLYQHQNKKQKNSRILRTGMSEVFDMNNSGSSKRRDSFLDDSDIGNDMVKDDEEIQKQGLTRNGQRNISFSIPRSKSKEFLDNIIQLSEIEKYNKNQKDGNQQKEIEKKKKNK